jgi:hypothetical protein
MAIDARDGFTRLPLVDAEVPRFPPEPFRFAGGEVIRAAMVRAGDDAEAERLGTARGVLRGAAEAPRDVAAALALLRFWRVGRTMGP